VTRWREVVEKSGMEGLAAKPHPGPHPRLSSGQKEKLLELLREGPKAHGYGSDLWTLKRVAKVIEKNFEVRYHPAHVWKILRACAWTCQKPERRARERDEDEIERWRKVEWPHIKKRAREKR
jgi:transposase